MGVSTPSFPLLASEPRPHPNPSPRGGGAFFENIMPQSVTLADARAFLRVPDAAEDAVLTLLIDAAEARVAIAAGVALGAASPAPLRLAVLILVAHAYEHRDAGEPSLALVEPWLAAYRKARL